jgi:hypothetical protein
MITAAIPIGRLTKKIQRQDRPEVSMPPSSGPMATARPVIAPQTPNATPRSLPWKAEASRASDTENMIAPPTPCRPRDSWSISVLVATPHSSEAPVKMNRPMMYRSRRPYMSARLPAVSSSEARLSAYASITHWSPEKLDPSAIWMSGRATFTIVMSSRSMKVPRQTATSVHHLALPPGARRPAGAALPGAAAGPGAVEEELVAVRAGPGERVAPWSGSGR